MRIGTGKLGEDLDRSPETQVTSGNPYCLPSALAPSRECPESELLRWLQRKGFRSGTIGGAAEPAAPVNGGDDWGEDEDDHQ